MPGIIKEKPKKQTNKQTNKQRQTRIRGDKSYSERVQIKWLCCTFKLGFLQLICKVSLIFKSNLESALSIILKQRELFESKHVAVWVWMFKNIRLVILFDMLLNPSFKITARFAKIARNTDSTSKFIY